MEENEAFPPPTHSQAPRTRRSTIASKSGQEERANRSASSPTKRSLETAAGGPGAVKRAKPGACPEQEPWNEAIHRAFVDAVFETGLRHSSPAVILESMGIHDSLTSERVKSHLQKYRNNKPKSKQEFLDEYDSWMQKALTVGAAGGVGSALVSPASVVDMMGKERVDGGDAAAFLTYSAMADEAELFNTGNRMGVGWGGSPDMVARLVTGANIPFPMLTDEERKSPLGISIQHVVGLFFSMTQHLVRERALGTRDDAGASR